MKMSAAALLLVLAFPWQLRADTLKLKNGNSISGIIKSEDQENVELEIDIGTVKFRRDELLAVERSTSTGDARELRDQWARQKEKNQREQQARIQIQDRLQGEVKEEKIKVDSETGHIITPALINGKVKVNLIIDTGATLVVLSKKVGVQLQEAGVRPKSGKVKEVDLTLGDGRKVKADFVTLEMVRIEDSSAENVDAAIMREDEAKPGYDGVLGMSFLNRFNFGFKQKEGKLMLEKLK
jgi:clan AA aspartic protease (TIGR02281 family)